MTDVARVRGYAVAPRKDTETARVRGYAVASRKDTETARVRAYAVICEPSSPPPVSESAPISIVVIQ